MRIHSFCCAITISNLEVLEQERIPVFLSDKKGLTEDKRHYTNDALLWIMSRIG